MAPLRRIVPAFTMATMAIILLSSTAQFPVEHGVDVAKTGHTYEPVKGVAATFVGIRHPTLDPRLDKEWKGAVNIAHACWLELREAKKEGATIGKRREVLVSGVSSGGKVVGAGPYAADSDLRVAAVHAGLVKVGETKTIVVQCGVHNTPLTGSVRNGVKTDSTTQVKETEVVILSSTSTALIPYETCMGACMMAWCRCPGEVHARVVTGSTKGRVFGTDVYTEDSSVGTAAVHMGLLKDGEEGPIAIYCVHGKGEYTNTTRHGVTTLPFGKFDAAFLLGKGRSMPPTPVPTPKLRFLEFPRHHEP